MTNPLQSFDRQLSWNTKFFVLLAFIAAVLSFSMEGTETVIFIASIIALIIVLLVDYYQIVSHKYPKLWRLIKIGIIGLIIILTLVGFLNA